MKNQIEHHSDMEPLRWAKLHPSYDGPLHCFRYPQYTCKEKRKEKKWKYYIENPLSSCHALKIDNTGRQEHGTSKIGVVWGNSSIA